MAEYQVRNNTFSMFPNMNKVEEKQPDFSGYVVINDERWPLFGYLKVAASGKEFVSGTIRPPEGQQAKPTNTPNRASSFPQLGNAVTQAQPRPQNEKPAPVYENLPEEIPEDDDIPF